MLDAGCKKLDIMDILNPVPGIQDLFGKSLYFIIQVVQSGSTSRGDPMIPLNFERMNENEMREAVERMSASMSNRRSVRHFSPESFPEDIVCRCVEIAHSAPSGANRQPWTFVIVKDAEKKKQIREECERSEREFYKRASTEKWREALEDLNIGPEKAFLEEAPFLVCAFAKTLTEDGERNYYVAESIGIACGFFIMAVHLSGLATLPYTPSDGSSLRKIIGCPSNERPVFVFPVGFPKKGCEVPDIVRKDAKKTIRKT